MIRKLKETWISLSRKKKITILISTILIISIIGVVLIKNPNILKRPTLTLVPPSPIEVSDKNEFNIDVKLSSLPKNLYPAASMSVGFDNNKLEFTGVKIGTMQTYGDKVVDGNEFDIPLWDCNKDVSNKKGQVNTMYMDMTAGKFAYNKDGFEKDSKDIVLRLGFKLKDSSNKGDVYDIDIKNAVFAAIDGDKDNTSLSTSKNTLKTNDCKVVVKK
ncbi:hypothetical protein [Paraclostridium sordellii]|uniref:Cohesin domain-containing protein n=1 Tax=Paraclostridium sordellii TaxID=1505 RepID=A0A0C7R592_PARSO|nr:hypothetical protein [Paeniclostridium sordellii]CEN78188.1 Uncharacterised protein [[Clostridium] sordellii] [Paeniclostridium sordellii]CEO07890.1 Uncharacterised protein [[Clostridium] sordellii] [Paeniclostridium sordellii]CEP87027.1 Uncharacterised protein [[Clostridium] sordellii] [Paeniclostridium sordellii]CEP95364.1 Uncharacterised protein [[Clostridium] sordellii] [Paeniclostridium sordellii]CEP99296.1 Uncharacterised protein [[Clostridium] sordellii] [Paeniclostridium sordellii]